MEKNDTEKIEKIQDYFEKEKESYEITHKIIFDPEVVRFRFEKKSQPIKLLEISDVVVEDLNVRQIIEKLEREDWKKKLELTEKGLILTHSGIWKLKSNSKMGYKGFEISSEGFRKSVKFEGAVARFDVEKENFHSIFLFRVDGGSIRKYNLNFNKLLESAKAYIRKEIDEGLLKESTRVMDYEYSDFVPAAHADWWIEAVV